jgi:hypothetical protein
MKNKEVCYSAGLTNSFDGRITMGIRMNGKYIGTVAPVTHGMIDAHAYIHNCVATWPKSSAYLQINAANEREPIHLTDIETARDKLRIIDGADICHRHWREER